MADAFVVIENIVTINEDPNWREYQLTILYDGKRALVALPVRTGRDAKEPGVMLCREELSSLANALAFIARSQNGILWQE